MERDFPPRTDPIPAPAAEPPAAAAALGATQIAHLL